MAGMSVISSWCGRENSNFHALRRYHLKVVRLPIPPRPHAGRTNAHISNSATRNKHMLPGFAVPAKTGVGYSRGRLGASTLAP